MELYPMKFTPIFKNKIWGGNKLKNYYRHNFIEENKVGESWDVSTLYDNDSEIENGFLAESTLSEAVEVYMEELVGGSVYDRFGADFPLLVKLIDANDKLSVQVHPNDDLARKLHDSNGKSELWYVMEAAPNAHIILGFNKEITPEEFALTIENNQTEDVLQRIKVEKGDVFYIPAGCVHALCEGVVICEIQQSSDITYRIYDYDRADFDGNKRDLHIEQAKQAVDYTSLRREKVKYDLSVNSISPLVEAECFVVNIMNIDKPKDYDLSEIDSFVLLTCVEGHTEVKWADDYLTLTAGETILIPASINKLQLIPTVLTKLLETYI